MNILVVWEESWIWISLTPWSDHTGFLSCLGGGLNWDISLTPWFPKLFRRRVGNLQRGKVIVSSSIPPALPSENISDEKHPRLKMYIFSDISAKHPHLEIYLESTPV